jgi:hypothetical protein
VSSEDGSSQRLGKLSPRPLRWKEALRLQMAKASRRLRVLRGQEARVDGLAATRDTAGERPGAESLSF